MRSILAAISGVLLFTIFPTSGYAGDEFLPAYNQVGGWRLIGGQIAALACVAYSCWKIWKDWKGRKE